MQVDAKQLSTVAQAQLAAYKATGELDSTGELYNEAYELLANAMHPRTRCSAELQYDYILRRIKQL
jgi:hypothetical protein